MTSFTSSSKDFRPVFVYFCFGLLLFKIFKIIKILAIFIVFDL